MRTVFDVDPSPGNRRDRRYGHKVINLKQKFRKRHPFLWVLVLCALVAGLFWSVREVSTRAEVTDVSPTTCLGDWENPSNAAGNPETLALPSSSFTSADSAVSNGSGTIFCGGFFSPSATPPPVGTITNVGLTLVWQVGDAATTSPALATSSTTATSSIISISSSSSVASSSDAQVQVQAPSTPTTTPPAQASTTSAPAVAPPPSPQSPPPPPAPVSPIDTSTPDDAAASSTGISFLRQLIPFAFADTEDASATNVATTVVLGAPLVAKLGPASSSVTSTIVASPATSTATSTTASLAPPSPTPLPPPSPDENFLDVSYSTDGQTWIEIQKVNIKNWQDITITLPITNWTDLQNLQIRITSIPTTMDPIPPVYLDGMFLEVHYNYTPLASQDEAQNSQPAAPPSIVVLSPSQTPPTVNDQQTDFTADQSPSFDFDLSSLAGSSTTSSTTPTTAPTASPTSTAPSSTPAVASTTTATSSATSISFNIINAARNFFALVERNKWWQWNEADAQTDGTDNIVMPTPADPVVAQIYDPDNTLTDLQPVTTIVNNELSVHVPPSPASFHPGRYTMKLWIYENNTIYVAAETFTWGVLVVNFDKSIYSLNDDTHIGFGVLNDGGHTICNAAVQAVVTSPSGVITNFDTANGSIHKNETCGPHTVTNNPDYSANMLAGEVGNYTIAVTARIPDGTIRTIKDSFAVENPPLFDVSRIGPTRIFPPAGYQMQITVMPNQNYSGPVVETVPSSFSITPNGGGVVAISGNTETITWQANLQVGTAATFSYSFLAPDVSPALYKLGPLQMGSWQEAREWQIAGDFATITLVQGAIVSCTVAGTACGVKFNANNTAGNMIIATVSWNSSSSAATSSIIDSKGNTYNVARGPDPNNTDGSQLEMFYAMNIAGGTDNVTATFHNSLKPLVTIQEFSGLATSSALDQSAFATSTTKNATTTAVTTTQAAELLFAFGANKTNSDTGSAGLNFTLINATSGGGATQWTASEYRVVAASSSYQGVMTINAAANWSLSFATFKAEASGIPPGVSNVILNGGSPIILTPNATTSISVTASTTQGGANLTYATATIYRSGVNANCAASNQNCYQIPSSSCTFSNSTSSVSCSAPIWYFAQPTDASSAFSGQSWNSAITVGDASGLAITSSTANGVTLDTLLAINVIPSSINYGILGASSTSGSTNATTSVSNVGNCSSTLQISGTALTLGANSIATGSQAYSTSTFTYPGTSTALTGSSVAISGFLLTGPTSTSTVSSTLFWGIAIPNGASTGTYTGANTFSAAFSN